jgi:hypothetical protein
VGGEDAVHDISLEATVDDPERVVMLVIHEKDGQIRADCKTEALSRRGGLHEEAHLVYRREYPPGRKYR